MPDEIDDEIKKLEAELKQLDDKDSGYGSPSAEQKDNLYKFFRHILEVEDTTRIGKIRDEEIGLCKLGIRHYQEIASYAEVEGLAKVAGYLIKKSQIITSTSMSRDGFWPQLFVTSIKREKKDKEPEKKKSHWFSKKTEEESD